jgi:glycosyltransferase involved in cell wall biosynthesis
MAIESANNGKLSVLIIFETLPLADGGGADHRLLQVVRLLRQQGHAVTFLAARSAGKHVQSSSLCDLGVEIRVDDSEVLRSEGTDQLSKWTLEELLCEGQFDLAIISLWFWMGVTLPEHYLDEIRSLSPQTRVAVLTDDCHGLGEQGRARISGLWSDRERAVDFTEREMETYRRADQVICISQSDREQIAGQVATVPIDVLPMMIEMPASTDLPGFDRRQGIVYLGHFNNPPTLDGLEWYIREVAPLVYRDLPDLKLYVVGAQLPANWSSPDPNVISVGFRADLTPEFAARRILVSPVRFGTGIKTKNLHAIAHGLPIVSNAKGAEGGNFVSGESALITETPVDFAAAIVRLYTDATFWQKLSQNSLAHARKYFSKQAMDSSLHCILDRSRTLVPQRYDPSRIWSMRLVEKMYADVLNYQPAHHRHAIRVLAYSWAAEDLIAEGDRAEARRQLRHIYNYFSHPVSRTVFFRDMSAVAESIERSYLALGDEKAAEAFRAEARQYSVASFVNAPSQHAVPQRSAELASAPAKIPDRSQPSGLKSLKKGLGGPKMRTKSGLMA